MAESEFKESLVVRKESWPFEGEQERNDLSIFEAGRRDFAADLPKCNVPVR